MYAKTAFPRVGPLLGAAVACALFVGNVVAKDKNVTVAIHVSTQGLDLNKPADARTFYTRLKNAAWLVCAPDFRATDYPIRIRCYWQALGDAVRASNKPMVTQIYLASHTLQEAAAHGIGLPSQLAAK